MERATSTTPALRNVELSAMSFRRQLKTELYLYTLENIRISTLVTVFTVRVGEHNFNVTTRISASSRL